MYLVVDANVIISSLINQGVTFKVFKENVVHQRFNFIAPEFLFSEIPVEKLQKLTQLPSKTIQDILDTILDRITMIPFTQFQHHFPRALTINEKDAPYIALALAYDCPIFSGDKGLKNKQQ